MGLAKSENFTATQNTLANTTRALAHPARIAILEKLLSMNSCAGSDIVQDLPLAQPTISRHLRVLRDAGLIQGTIEGNHVNYCIDPYGWEIARDALMSLMSRKAQERNCC